jgi:hypothetical protein
MKALALTIFLVLPVVAQVNSDVTLVQEFDPRQGCETMERLLDSLFIAATESESTAYVVIHQGTNVFDNAIVHNKANSYVRFRGFPIDRYTVLLTKGSGDIRVALWVGKKPPSIVPSDLDLTVNGRPSRRLLLEDTVEMVQIDGKETYIGTGNPSCLYLFLPSLVWPILEANPRFDAEFRIRTKSPSRYRHLVGILRREFRADKAPVGRFNFVYAGRDKEIEGGGSKLASITTSLVKTTRK